jgi:hypothetical protein
MGPRLEGALSKPSVSNRRIFSSRVSSRAIGFITAMGFPRSVKTTSLPDLTALIAFENR